MDFDKLHKEFHHFFKHGKNLRPNCKYIFFMALDGEWYEENGRNVVLSYQIATATEGITVNPIGAAPAPEGRTNNIIEYMPHGKRLKLAELVELGLRSVLTDNQFKQLRGEKVQIILIAHAISAEWSALKDRHEDYITRRLCDVRKSPITDGNSIKITIANSIPVGVKFFDTILLSPAGFRSLKRLSGLLGSKEAEKEPITQFYIENMNLYLRDHPKKFKKYALKDSEITLKLFFLLQQSLNKLVTGLKVDEKLKEGLFRLYRTLASAGMKSFIDKYPDFTKYRDTLPEKFPIPYQLITRSYLGGRSESFWVGRTNDHPETSNKLWLDIDFSSCYPVSMALSPKLDFSKGVQHFKRLYRIDDDIANELIIKENIPKKTIDPLRKVKTKFHGSIEVFDTEEFDKKMIKIKNKDHSLIIREKASVYDNTLIDNWHNKWKQAKEAGDKSIEEINIPGFARVKFKFTKGTMFPCLPIRHPRYGLLYVLEGETTVPAAEIMLAMDIPGAEINALTSIEFQVETDNEGKPIRFLLDHLKELVNKRKDHKDNKKDPKSQVMEKLLKEFTNSMYGKVSQSVTEKTVSKVSTGEKVSLRKSVITEPCTAALVTSLARAALSAALLGVEKFNKDKLPQDQATVISATTDGFLVGIPCPESFTVTEDYYTYCEGCEQPPELIKEAVEHELPTILKRFGYHELLDEIYKFLPIRQMRHSRQLMTGSKEILEIKHLADEIISIKTRGQIGSISTGHKVLVARFNLKPPLSEIIEDKEEYKRIMDTGGVEKDTEDANWIIRKLDDIESGEDEIDTYSFITLNTFSKMNKSKDNLDLTKNVKDRVINTDFDWKRKLVSPENTCGTSNDTQKVSPLTVPHKNVTDMIKHRNVVESIRRTGLVAKPELVLHRLEVIGKSQNSKTGDPLVFTRMFLRAIVRDKIDSNYKYRINQQKEAGKINTIWEKMNFTAAYPKTWSVNDFKNSRVKKTKKNKKTKEDDWEPPCILPNIVLSELVEELAISFDADPEAIRATLYGTEEFKRMNSELIEYVITAIMNAPKNKIEPFYNFQQKGLLPGRQKIIETFRHQLSGEKIKKCFNQLFIPGQLPSYKNKNIKKIFYRLGLPNAKAAACAKSLAPPSQVLRGKRRNPGQKKCTDHFLSAILQGDIQNREIKRSELLKSLRKFGVNKNGFHAVKEGSFTPNCIKDTPQNRQQISSMARACTHDPVQFLDILIEK